MKGGDELIFYNIHINSDNSGNINLSFDFKGDKRKDNADVDYIIGIARELKFALEKLHDFNTAYLERTSKRE